MIIVEHDNGVKGQWGYTEYTPEEITSKYGNIDGLKKEYAAAGITVYNVSK